MRSNVYPPMLAVALLPALTSSQNYPACAQSCVTQVITAAGCAITDVPCYCGETGFFQVEPNLQTCVAIACSSQDIEGDDAMVIFDDTCTSYLADPGAYSTSTTPTKVSVAAATTVTEHSTAVSGNPATVTSSSRVAGNSANVKTDVLPTTSTTSLNLAAVTSAANVVISIIESIRSVSSAEAAATAAATVPGSSSTNPAGTSSSSSTSGLSNSAKAGVGIGVTLGVIAIAAVFFIVYWDGKRSSAGKKNEAETLPRFVPRMDDKAAEPDPKTAENIVSPISEGEDLEKPLTVSEKAELEGRRRAAELQGQAALPINELGANERVELEARRRIAREVYELH